MAAGAESGGDGFGKGAGVDLLLVGPKRNREVWFGGGTPRAGSGGVGGFALVDRAGVVLRFSLSDRREEGGGGGGGGSERGLQGGKASRMSDMWMDRWVDDGEEGKKISSQMVGLVDGWQGREGEREDKRLTEKGWRRACLLRKNLQVQRDGGEESSAEGWRGGVRGRQGESWDTPCRGI